MLAILAYDYCGICGLYIRFCRVLPHIDNKYYELTAFACQFQAWPIGILLHLSQTPFRLELFSISCLFCRTTHHQMLSLVPAVVLVLLSPTQEVSATDYCKKDLCHPHKHIGCKNYGVYFMIFLNFLNNKQ